MADQSRWPSVVLRVAIYLLLAVLVGLLALAGVVVWQSMGPDPGGNMVLMALPLLALPASVVGLLLMGIGAAGWRLLHPVERGLCLASGLVFLPLLGALYLLG